MVQEDVAMIAVVKVTPKPMALYLRWSSLD